MTITVTTTSTAQSAATTFYLSRAGVEYDTVPGKALNVVCIDDHGTKTQWQGFRPDRLAEAVAEMTAVPA